MTGREKGRGCRPAEALGPGQQDTSVGVQHGLVGAGEESAETSCGHRPGECGQPRKYAGALVGI